ncbi:hypothetical protein TTHERM_01099130 (macronuclear) [Tetrahymena thermophila SB210]|uniref:N-acetyltransferase domain-containing protein n=1 Tax=Tetrahymena thermophila (strain SB210) TaxID=312017 RepID=Q22BK0_TETTS|nr:hypothetical protein TTHERM_01099130 [Tetrahymena thermophila SB210]EAR82666.1 hypothetical protein TTHERM_01099130 [Tetrahymena thermophila SB210]|eukprot:XP_001030329.1 hypothetical protein TTHERM_01099130 [Tetrahymena thermophila SB210]
MEQNATIEQQTQTKQEEKTQTQPAPAEKPARRTDYTLDIMREEHLEDCVKLIYDSFTKTNPLWMRFQTTYEEIAPFLRWRLQPALATQTGSILICDNKIVACQIGVDYVDYWNQRREGFPLPQMFKVITKYHDECMGKDLDPELPRNTCVMNHYTAVDPAYQSQGFYPALNKNGFRVTKLGYTNSFTITTNPITQGKSQTYKGVNNIRTVKVEDPESPLCGIQFDLIEIPLVYGDTSSSFRQQEKKTES